MESFGLSAAAYALAFDWVPFVADSEGPLGDAAGSGSSSVVAAAYAVVGS